MKSEKFPLFTRERAKGGEIGWLNGLRRVVWQKTEFSNHGTAPQTGRTCPASA